TRDYQREPSSLEIPNLVITLPETRADQVYAWQDDFLIKGNNGDDKEKSGSIEFLSPNLKDVYFTLNFGHLDIFHVDASDDSSPDQVRRVTAEMYVETVDFSMKTAGK